MMPRRPGRFTRRRFPRRAQPQPTAGWGPFQELASLITDYAFRLGVSPSGEVTITEVSGNYNQLTGRSLDQVSTLDQWASVIHPDDLPLALAELGRLLKGPGSIEIDCRLLRRGSEIRWTRIYARSERDERQQRVVAVLGAVKDITERKLAQQDLQESEERYRAMVYHMPSGVVVYRATSDGKSFTIQDFNPAAERIERRQRSQVVGREVLEVFPGVRATDFIDSLGRVYRTGAPEQVPAFMYRDPERTGWRENVLFRLPDGDVVAVYSDVTDQVRAQEALRESEEKFRVLIESINDIVFTLDREQRHTGVYGGWLKAAGLRPEALMGKTAIEFFGPKLGEAHAAANRRALCGETVVYEWQSGSGPGTQHIQTSLSPLRNAQREITGLVGVGRDVTALKRAEAAAATEQERLLVTLRSIADGVITTAVDGTVTLMNAVAEDVTGWQSETAAGRPLGEVFQLADESTRERCADPAEQVIAFGAVAAQAEPSILVARDGSETLIAHSGAPIRNRDGTILGVVIVFRDVTETRKTEERLRNAAKLEALGVLAGGIAHDFNNLLSGLFGYIDLARDRLPAEHPAAEYLGRSLEVFARARGLTQQLLTFSKGGRPHKRTTDLGPLIRDAVQFTLSGSAITAQVSVAADLWPCDVDENQLAQVIDNLVLNARQSMPGGGTITVTAVNLPTTPAATTSPGADSLVRISIRDTGVGILRENLPRIFDPFFTTKQAGTGLGLATAYSIIRQHSGIIEVESEVDHGSTFHVYLPATSQRVPSIVTSKPSPTRGRGRVLVMDDEEFMRRVASRMLVSLGYQVTTVGNGAEAIGSFQAAVTEQQPYAAVILDLTIAGGLGGRETLEHLRTLDPNLKAVASSGYSDDPVMAEPSAFGFAAKLPKPYTRTDLSRVLGEVFRHLPE